MCRVSEELEELSKQMENVNSFDEFEMIGASCDELCFKIANCNIKCGNPGCQFLQKSLYNYEELCSFEEELVSFKMHDIIEKYIF